jgi:hypothetical protein
MGLVAETTRQRVDVPHEDGEWFEIAPLTWADLETARRLKTEGAIKQAAMFSADTLRGIQTQGDGTATVADPVDALDMETVLRAGVKAWSYAEPVTPETIGRLDEPTAQWVFAEIAGRSILSKEEQGNGVAPPNVLT